MTRHRREERGAYFRAFTSAIAILSVVLTAGGAHADAAKVTASMQCERAAEAGRVRCSVEVHVEGGARIAWADVAIVDLPDFSSALKGRLGPADVTAREASFSKWAFGLIAKRPGQGEARARVHLVLCEGAAPSARRCTPRSVDVRTKLAVGG